MLHVCSKQQLSQYLKSGAVGCNNIAIISPAAPPITLQEPTHVSFVCNSLIAVRNAAYGTDGKQYSLLEYILRETEQLHARVRRYTSPDEHAFFPGKLYLHWL